MVATRLVTEESMDLVNNAENIDALNGISFVTMLLERFETVSYGTHSDIPIADKVSTLQNLVTRYGNLDAVSQLAVLQKVFEGKPYARSQATTDALAVALTEVEAAIDARLVITGVSVADNGAYASTAAGGGTVRVLGYGVGINLDAKSEGKTVGDTTSIVVELYKEGTLLGQQTFNEAGYTKHGGASLISGTIDAGGEYVATSWDNSWSAKINEIPTRAVATVQYTDGTATAETALSFTTEQTKIFFAAEAVHALFANPFADAETLELKEGVTQENITTASELVNAVAVSEGSSHKTLFGEMITKANALSGEGNVEQEANIEMMQFVPEKPIAEETLEVEAETEAIAEETIESDEATTDAVAGNEVNEEKITEETTVEADETQLEGDKEVIEEDGVEAVEVTDEEVPVEGEEEVVEETAGAEESIEEIQETEEE